MSGAVPWPVVAAVPEHLCLTIGRVPGAVVVTVEGDVDLAAGEVVDAVLTDLIEGQGNGTVTLDLTLAALDTEASVLLDAAAARRAGPCGGTLVVRRAHPAPGST